MSIRSINKELEEVKKIVEEIKAELDIIKSGRSEISLTSPKDKSPIDEISSKLPLAIDFSKEEIKEKLKPHKLVIRKKPITRIST